MYTPMRVTGATMARRHAGRAHVTTARDVEPIGD